MNSILRAVTLIVCIAALGLSGCATLDQNHENPKVDVIGITKGDSTSSALQFKVQLRIVNPNAKTLQLSGLYYELSLEGIDMVTGTAKDLPPIEGFSEAVVSVSAGASLLSSARLAHRLITEPQDMLNYELKAKLGTTSRWIPSTTVVDRGQISL